MNNRVTVTKSSMPPFEEYIEKIKPLWDSRWLTNMGRYHNELEEALKKYLEVSYVSLMVNGHTSLELAIQAMNFPKGSEIITTPFTFISTTHAIVRNQLKPVFCDIKIDDYTIDASKIESLITAKTVAIIPVHVYGNICEIEKIEEIALKYNLTVIYDAAHAFGEKLNGTSIANFGDASVFSFHATKVYHTIEGGAITFSERKLYEKLLNLKNFGIYNEKLILNIGTNAKMNEFSAIMGLCNLKYINQNIALRKEKAILYIEKLSKNNQIIIPTYEKKNVNYNYSYFPIRFINRETRDKVCNNLCINNIFARKYFYPLTSDASCYKNRFLNTNLKIAHEVSTSILVLPLYPELDNNTIEKICDIIVNSL